MRRREVGFTMIELLLGIGVLALLSAVLSAVLVTAQRSAAIERVRSDLITENRLLVDETVRNVKQARSVVTSATLFGTTYTTDGDTLVLAIPAIDANQNLLANTYDYQVWQQSGTNYQFIQDGATASVRPDTPSRLFSRRVSSVTFRYYDQNGILLTNNYPNTQRVEVSVTLSESVRGKSIISTMSDRATLRNR
jgi:type II secretory pathway pseudopilin PulG